jgi:hypothetical protein
MIWYSDGHLGRSTRAPRSATIAVPATAILRIYPQMKKNLGEARSESPSTDRFYSLISLVTRTGEEYADFRRRVMSLTAIPVP